jgi:uncharacterized protein with HEPN domain
MNVRPRDDIVRLADILAATRLIAEYISDGESAFFASTKTQDAVIRQLELIGEAAGKVSSKLRDEHPGVPWKGMRGFASFATHESWKLELRRVWNEAVKCSSISNEVARIRSG